VAIDLFQGFGVQPSQERTGRRGYLG